MVAEQALISALQELQNCQNAHRTEKLKVDADKQLLNRPYLMNFLNNHDNAFGQVGEALEHVNKKLENIYSIVGKRAPSRKRQQQWAFQERCRGQGDSIIEAVRQRKIKV